MVGCLPGCVHYIYISIILPPDSANTAVIGRVWARAVAAAACNNELMVQVVHVRS